jgi:protein-S-isoprenylcysteine O-methyltransferase Ste14
MIHPPMPGAETHLPPLAMALAMLIPITAMVTPFIFTYAILKLKNKRETLLIEKGIYRQPTAKEKFRQFYLTGMILLFLGLGLFLAMLPIGLYRHVQAEGMSFFGPWLIPGILLSFLGVGFLVFAKTAYKPHELLEQAHDEA